MSKRGRIYARYKAARPFKFYARLGSRNRWHRRIAHGFRPSWWK